jgi:hypothetical protein
MSTQSLFAVGTLVRLSEYGRIQYPKNPDGMDSDNPHYINGTIKKSYIAWDGTTRYKVDWENGQRNDYTQADLEIGYEGKLKRSESLVVDAGFVRAAYKAACTDWKERLQEQFPDFEFEPKPLRFGSIIKIMCDSRTGYKSEGLYRIVNLGENKVMLIDTKYHSAWKTEPMETNPTNIDKEELGKYIAGDTTGEDPKYSLVLTFKVVEYAAPKVRCTKKLNFSSIQD